MSLSQPSIRVPEVASGDANQASMSFKSPDTTLIVRAIPDGQRTPEYPRGNAFALAEAVRHAWFLTARARNGDSHAAAASSAVSAREAGKVFDRLLLDPLTAREAFPGLVPDGPPVMRGGLPLTLSRLAQGAYAFSVEALCPSCNHTRVARETSWSRWRDVMASDGLRRSRQDVPTSDDAIALLQMDQHLRHSVRWRKPVVVENLAVHAPGYCAHCLRVLVRWAECRILQEGDRSATSKPQPAGASDGGSGKDLPPFRIVSGRVGETAEMENRIGELYALGYRPSGAMLAPGRGALVQPMAMASTVALAALSRT